MPRFHHSRYGVIGIAGMPSRFVLTDGGVKNICGRKMTTLYLPFIEYHFVRDVWRSLVPIRIVVIETDSKDRSLADIRAAPPTNSRPILKSACFMASP